MNASTNASFDLNEIFLISIGSSWLTDSIYVFLITPLGLISFLSNSISFMVFLKIDFQNVTLFSYLRGFSFILKIDELTKMYN
jgi:hypothetical protein